MLSRVKTGVAAIAMIGAVGVAGSAEAQMRLSMATPWTGGHWFDIGAKGFAERVEFLTEGRVVIEVFPAGTLGSPLATTETVETGIAEVGHAWPGYDWGIDTAAVLLGGWAGGFTPEEYLLWLWNGGGAEIWEEYRREVFNVVAVPCGVLETEIFMHAHEPVRTLEDYEGLRVRTSGAWAEIAEKLGASTVVMPGGEVYSALERQVVDGIEWGGPGINLSAGFHNIAKYIIMPGIHSPAAAHDCVFNVDVWDQIDERDQDLIRLAGRLMTLDTFLGYAASDIAGFDALQAAGDNEFVQLDSSFIEAAVAASNEWAEEKAAENEWFARIYEHQKAFYATLEDWNQFRLPIAGR
ncbi:MAG: C4-dicarboxylate ABC transporter substrate-binding protein [Pseudomonadota bacterium]